jgi:hypothetical protein
MKSGAKFTRISIDPGKKERALHLKGAVLQPRQNMILGGRFRILFFYDVADSFDLDRIREALGSRTGQVKQVFPRRTPEYIRFEHTPIFEPAQICSLRDGEQVECAIRYYSYGIAVAQLEIPFTSDWKSLVQQSSRWLDTSETEPHARELVESHLARVPSSIVAPLEEWLKEEYLVIDLQEIRQDGAARLESAELLRDHGAEIVQALRGEEIPLSSATIQEVLQTSLSYYVGDLVVVEPSAAFVYDLPEGAAATSQVLEYARMQLLEFRYYDNFMTRVLSNVYDALDQPRNLLRWRWRLPQEANRLNTIRLDVMELSERIDNALKFVSDLFYARVYRLAASRIGVPEYRRLVDQKLRTAGELYNIMVTQFNDARSFATEIAIAILCFLDVILLLRSR